MQLLRTGRETGKKGPPSGKRKIKDIHRENPNNAFSTLEEMVLITLTELWWICHFTRSLEKQMQNTSLQEQSVISRI